jgi:CRP-like cAMP-binding protein
LGRKVNVVQSKKFASCCPVPTSYQKIANKLNFADGEIAFIYNRFRDGATER